MRKTSGTIVTCTASGLCLCLEHFRRPIFDVCGRILHSAREFILMISSFYTEIKFFLHQLLSNEENHVKKQIVHLSPHFADLQFIFSARTHWILTAYRIPEETESKIATEKWNRTGKINNWIDDPMNHYTNGPSEREEMRCREWMSPNEKLICDKWCEEHI